MADPGGASFTVRPPGRAATAIAASLFGAVSIVNVVVSLTHRHLPVWVTLTVAVTFGLLVTSAVLSWRTRITVSAGGVEARDQWGRLRRFAWPEVHHFERRGYWRGVSVRTIDGRWMSLLPTGGYAGVAADYVARLEQYRWARQHELGLI